MEEKRKGGQLGNKNAEKWTEEEALKLGNDLLDWMKADDNFWVKEYLINNDLNDTLTNYLSHKYDSFSSLVEKAFSIQEKKLVSNGLKNKWNNAMAIFVLKNKHGYKDKTEVDNNVKLEDRTNSVLKRVKLPSDIDE